MHYLPEPIPAGGWPAKASSIERLFGFSEQILRRYFGRFPGPYIVAGGEISGTLATTLTIQPGVAWIDGRFRQFFGGTLTGAARWLQAAPESNIQDAYFDGLSRTAWVYRLAELSATQGTGESILINGISTVPRFDDLLLASKGLARQVSPEWDTLPLAAGWISDTNNLARYGKDQFNVVRLRGGVETLNLTAAENQTAFTLPVGHRPGNFLRMVVAMSANPGAITTAYAWLTISANGECLFTRFSPLPDGIRQFYLDGLSFVAN